MLSPEMTRLAEAVRALNLLIVVKNDVERVRLNTPPEEFPNKLLELQKALLALDSAEGKRAEAASDGEDDEEREKNYLHHVSEALVYKIKKSMGDTREAVEIVNDALREFAGAGWAEPQLKMYEGRTRRKAQERREERSVGATPRLTEKSVQGLDSALHAAESYRLKALERARKDMERRSLLQAELEGSDGGDEPDAEDRPSSSIR